MAAMHDFDLLNTPLKGTSLVEASAGTGKTYSITGLILRLVLEKDIPINEILVVTYTEAATSELKDRTRRRLREAAQAFSGEPTDDAFLLSILDRFPDSAAALKKLNCAINDFDEASIFTIHGFCLRTLLDHAFASGVLLDTELVTTEETLLRESVQDFWRKHFYGASPLFYNYAREKGLDLAGLQNLAQQERGNPYIRIIPQKLIPDCTALEAEFRQKFEAACKIWRAGKDEIVDKLVIDPGLNRTKYRADSIPKWAKLIDGFLTGECLSCTPCDYFEKFTIENLGASLKKGNVLPPSHPFFNACTDLLQVRESLEAIYNDRVLGLKFELLTHVRAALEVTKLRKNILFFDDLLVRLEKALAGPNGEHLAQIVRTRFKAALIDEFQDTDSIQYTIFEKIFGIPGSVLFLIGDPKQAIYGFRGADIFTYMGAAKSAAARFTLGENWRSEPDLISAVNTLFSSSERPFIFEDIPFISAKAAAGKEHEFLTIDRKSEAPAQVWFCRDTEDGQMNKGTARDMISRAVAAEISRLLSMAATGKALIGTRPLREGDIAVLVRTNYQAGLVKKALSALDVHAVLYDVDNVFKSHEAMEVERILAAVSDPQNERLLKAALVTDTVGVSGEELDRLLLNDAGFDSWIIKFLEYKEGWAKHGFFRMFRSLLINEGVLPRLMSLMDGERRCTNVLHLAELLQNASSIENLSMAGLVKWLAVQMDENTPEREEHQLRLESDENAVKIVTIHKSKGLEYPVVFCPFNWEGSKIGDSPLKFHDVSVPHAPLTLDLGSEELPANRALALKEELSENLRLFYVAMTRAKHRCYFVWGDIKGAESSAPAWLLHGRKSASPAEPASPLQELIVPLDVNSMWKDLEEIRDKASGSIGLSEMSVEAGIRITASESVTPTLEARSFQGRINRDWRISSFSSLVSDQQHKAEIADRDESDTEVVDTTVLQHREASLDMFSFPRGAAAGIVLHDVFEHLDFTSPMDAAPEAVARKLREHGFDSCWVDPVCGMIRNVLTTPLGSSFGTVRLSEMCDSDRLNELEFHYPISGIDLSQLQKLFASSGSGSNDPALLSLFETVRFQRIEGFMRGFIDMVFRANGRYHILDWKSNFLGPTVESYGQDALRKAVADNFYNLQYAIYAVALHQYLKNRVPDYSYKSHFGEVFYVFLRGVDPAKGPEYGIYKDRPREDAIESLSATLIGRKDDRAWSIKC